MTTDNAVQDPVCGMNVDPSASCSSDFEGNTYYFCCNGCRQKFDSNPKGVLAARAEKNEQQVHQISLGPTPSASCCHGAHGSPRKQPAGAAQDGALYTCPMHPEIEQVGPGSCPICGMDLEPKFIDASDNSDEQQLQAMKLRFWVGAALSVPLILLAMGPMLGLPVSRVIPDQVTGWLQLALATPVVFWCGWPLLVRGVNSFRTMNLNMFSLIAVGTVAAFFFSLIVVLFPQLIPSAFYEEGKPPLYFEASAVIITLVLMGQVLELRARQQTGGAIRELMQLAPDSAHRITDDGEEEVELNQVHQGDRLRVRPGEKVPVDGRVLSGSSRVDESIVRIGADLHPMSPQGFWGRGSSLSIFCLPRIFSIVSGMV